jgi:hypothetical protein
VLNNRLPLAGLIATALALPAAACSSGPSTSGPLGPPGNYDFQCLPARLDHTDSDGVQNFKNYGHSTIVINHVTLAAPRHLKLTGAIAIPGIWLAGSWLSYPPPAAQLPRDVRWSQHRPAAGFQVLPGHWVNIVLGVEATAAPGGRSPGMIVAYHIGSSQYVLQSHVAVIIKVPPARC